jgi:hypothetical protein
MQVRLGCWSVHEITIYSFNQFVVFKLCYASYQDDDAGGGGQARSHNWLQCTFIPYYFALMYCGMHAVSQQQQLISNDITENLMVTSLRI